MLEGRMKEGVLRRLRRIRGQVVGLARMVDNGRYCIEVLQQVSAVEAALHRAAEIILQNHLETCVTDTFQSEGARDRREKIEELVRIYAGMRPK